MRIHDFIKITTLGMLVLLCACSGKKNQDDRSNHDEQAEPNEERVNRREVTKNASSKKLGI